MEGERADCFFRIEKLALNPMKMTTRIQLEFEEGLDLSSLGFQVLSYDQRAGILRLLAFGRQVELGDVVDESEQIDGPTLRVARMGEDFVLWGGLNIYLIRRQSEKLARIQLPRRLEDTEYWRYTMVRVDGMMLFICESCVTAVDEAFQVVWETKVFYDHVFQRIVRGRLEFEDTDGGRL